MVFTKPPQSEVPPQPEEQNTPSRGIVPWYKRPSILSQARTTDELGVTRPEVFNLRDHKELNGVRYAIVGYEEHTGNIDGRDTEYLVLAGFEVDEQGNEIRPLAIMTGSSDVVARLSAFKDVIDAGTPVIGHFRNQNRAWFFD